MQKNTEKVKNILQTDDSVFDRSQIEVDKKLKLADVHVKGSAAAKKRYCGILNVQESKI